MGRTPVKAGSLSLARAAYSVQEVAAMFGVPVRTVYDTVRAGHLPAMRWGVTGKTIRILAADLEAWAQRQREEAAERLVKETWFDE